MAPTFQEQIRRQGWVQRLVPGARRAKWQGLVHQFRGRYTSLGLGALGPSVRSLRGANTSTHRETRASGTGAGLERRRRRTFARAEDCCDIIIILYDKFHGLSALFSNSPDRGERSIAFSAGVFFNLQRADFTTEPVDQHAWKAASARAKN